MDREEWQRRGRSFSTGPDAYDEYRPDYSPDAVRWLAGTGPARILELGAGTGKLTRPLVERGNSVIASDVSAPMLQRLRHGLPGIRTVVCTAEDIPLTESSVDLVVAAQAYHWFDPERALPEIARVLRPGGLVGLVWNRPDLTIPWVRRLFGLLGVFGDTGDPLESAAMFAPTETRSFRNWQDHTKESLLGFAASSSHLVTMEPAKRAATLDQVGTLYDEYGRGRGGMRLPWETNCYRARVLSEAKSASASPDNDDGLLIDFNW